MKTIEIFKIGIILSLFLTNSSCEEKKLDLEVEEKNLMQASREWSRAASERDVEKVLDYWNEDAIVISAGQPDLKGKEAIRGMVEGSMNDPNFSIGWEPISAEIAESGDMGYLLENAKITMTDSTGTKQIQNLKSVTIWKKQDDGSWKNVVDVMIPK
ncbi:nuclear transport factor 2 family protein [Arenibacter sp. BSSL-BM3]|uniref:Nuclear transport factor 2 family protein n=1 Tax=Arenibacter arenosicollis TaxID=2762274 RepID=A0ABR7QQZ9_9FLAO|nr:DUF4440 domain-containing protein [Arenibacter arenosicollis]MBC8769337.1 nuclear transport factor 2 family protein [Arenibacter arenosicollis]